MNSLDLFDETEWHPEPASPAIGMTVKLDRDIDRQKPCCENLAVIHAGKPPHAGELRCADCGAHRGWAPKALLDFLNAIARRFGAPAGLITWRQGDTDMANDYDNTNRGALFKNDEKESDKHPDYRGPLNVDGREFWISGWLKTSKKGTKYMSLSIKPQDADKSKPKASTGDEMNDSIPF